VAEAPKISHKAQSSKLFALVVLQGQWRCPLKQRIAWWKKWLVNRLLRPVLWFDGLKDRIAADNNSRVGGRRQQQQLLYSRSCILNNKAPRLLHLLVHREEMEMVHPWPRPTAWVRTSARR
jgi:hypothetical protein